MRSLFKNVHLENSEIEFNKIAKVLFTNYELVINQNNYNLTEIEFYYFNTKIHKDVYTHLHCMQLEFNKFYVHEKSANRGGIDLTFGDGNNFGGILIRGIQRQSDNTIISGPAKVRGEITKTLFELNELKDDEKFYKIYNEPHEILQEKINSSNMEFKPNNKDVKDLKIIATKRIGLREKILCDADKFLNRKYRFKIET